MTLEDLIAEVHNRGLYLNNLGQLHDGRWQANVTDWERYWEFGRGPDAISALQAALYLQSSTAPGFGIEQSSRVLKHARTKPAKATDEDLAKLIGSL